ncbi:MAG TPA: response regulator [Polyangiaceae bacterium]|nr:response regulator [Polyangiaceae bacterium]
MSSPRVLVIDDDEIVRELMCELLRERGCDVFDAGSPIGVTRLIVQHQIDIVVLDVMMPDISGDKLAKLLRRNAKLQKLTIVLVSSGKHEDLSQLASDVAADSVVSKSEIRSQLAVVALAAHRRRAFAAGRGRTGE